MVAAVWIFSSRSVGRRYHELQQMENPLIAWVDFQTIFLTKKGNAVILWFLCLIKNKSNNWYLSIFESASIHFTHRQRVFPWTFLWRQKPFNSHWFQMFLSYLQISSTLSRYMIFVFFYTHDFRESKKVTYSFCFFKMMFL